MDIYVPPLISCALSSSDWKKHIRVSITITISWNTKVVTYSGTNVSIDAEEGCIYMEGHIRIKTCLVTTILPLKIKDKQFESKERNPTKKNNNGEIPNTDSLSHHLPSSMWMRSQIIPHSMLFMRQKSKILISFVAMWTCNS